MEVKREECEISYTDGEIVVQGTMRLFGAENYKEIENVFTHAVEDRLATLVLDITKLRFLNSSGINVFFKFLIALKKQGHTQLTIKGTDEFFWQKKTLLNFQKILPTTQLVI
ncbi:MAG: STAS domain-containing protein [Deltaproteobacteria bacterium]|nr:STAS domain-containing protein [Deltaproteobacteria bacterium]